MPSIEHPQGNYRYLPGIAPYSCGVVNSPGFEIVHVTFRKPPEYQRGFAMAAELLESQGRPKTALCSISLRSPCPYTFDGFQEFNSEYTRLLREWGVFVDDVNPIARTNVAPVLAAPTVPVLYGFAFTRPRSAPSVPTFVVAGAGELPEGILRRDAIIALGDIRPQAMNIKAEFVMDLMEQRLKGLGLAWSHVQHINVYTVHSPDSIVSDIVLPRVGPAGIHGVHWHYSRPPIEEIEFEMDLRGVSNEIIL